MRLPFSDRCQPSMNGQPITEEAYLRHELERARIALALLKEKLGIDGIRDLLQGASDEMHDEVHAAWDASDGKWASSAADVTVKGARAEEFLAWFRDRAQANDQGPLLGGHPEHYLVSPTADGRLEVIETTGHWRLPHRFYMKLRDDPQNGPDAADMDPDFPFTMAGAAHLDDGCPVARVLHQFRNTDDGFEARLKAYFPAGSPPELLEGHNWHLILEFTNWVSIYLEARDGE